MTAPDPYSTSPVAGADPDRQARAMRKDKPVKTAPLERRQGVVTAVDVAGGTCTIILGDSGTEIPGVIHLSNYRPHAGDTVAVLVHLGPSVIADAKSASIITSDFTTSTLYEFMGGPNLVGVSVSPSGRLLVQISALAYSLNTASLAMMGVQLFHNEFDFQIDPTALYSLAIYSYQSSGLGVAASKVNLYTDLPPGNYTLGCYYVSESGNPCYFSERHIWALPL